MAGGQAERMDLLRSAPVSKALAALGIPIMIGMLVSALYNLVDAYFVAGLGESAMGAISVVYPIGQVVVGIGLLFGTGAASYVSRLLGRGAMAAANCVVSTAVYGSVLVGVVYVACVALGLDPLLRALGASDTMMPDARAYAAMYLVGLLLNGFNVTMNNVVSCEGAARRAMVALLAGACLNMALDPVLIYGAGLGVAGAGLATVFGQLLTAALYVWYMLGGQSLFTFGVRDCRWSGEVLGQIFKIGVPTLTFQLLGSLAIAMTNVAAAPYGDSAVAAFGAVARIMSVGSLVVFGFIKGLQPIAGFSYGAHDIDRLMRAIQTAAWWSTGFCLVFGAVVAGAADYLMGLFAGDNLEMAGVGALALRVQGISFSVFGFYTVYSSVLLALGKAGWGMVLGSCRQGLCLVPLMAVLPLAFGFDGLVWAQPCADVLSAFAAVWVARGLAEALKDGRRVGQGSAVRQ